jgi:methylmalonyl-CoA mutase N-terminal domain/subunit
MENKEQYFSGSGIPVKEIYTPDDVENIDYDKDIGLAGGPPFTRGVYSSMYRGRLWTIRRYSGVNTPEETNELYRREYELGQTGFSVATDVPTGCGIDADDPAAFADVGDAGVPVSSLRDMETTFEGLPIDTVATALEVSTVAGCPLTAMYFAMAEKRGLDVKHLRGTTLNDVTASATCAHHRNPMPPQALLRLSVDLIEWCCGFAPKWHPMCLDSYPYREQGINAVQELGLLLATDIQYIEEEQQRGKVALDKFVRRFSFNMGVHNDLFEEIAKLRAGRRMWYKISRERYGIEDPRCWQFRLHVQSSGCTHTTQEPLNNLIRIAYQMLAAVLGGAQSMHANGYDEGICLPIEKLKQFKKERDNAEVAQALQELERITRSDENIMPAVLEAVKAYATVGEIANVWHKVYGIWSSPMGI